ncbi:Hypothetical predicted protein [Octopus vulgaris]|uniref:Uncharacterized protein n=1 Tax=Octopus vulgaris TaxID=6645 RepID=A0AA36BGM9_OCTVU|nr:Hypothetical predicted protein [Octopus vulgaris]
MEVRKEPHVITSSEEIYIEQENLQICDMEDGICSYIEISAIQTRESPEENSPELATFRDRILELKLLEERKRLSSLKSCERVKIKSEIGKANEVVMRISVMDTTELNSLMYATAYVITEKMGMFRERKKKDEDV